MSTFIIQNIHRVKFVIYCFHIIPLCKDWIFPLLGLLKVSAYKKERLIVLKNDLKFIFLYAYDPFTLIEIIFLNEYRLKHAPSLQIVIDIGANCGVFSVYAASLHKRTRVYSYEPSDEAYRMLKNNICLNGMEKRIHPFKKAILSTSKKVRLYSMGPTSTRSVINEVSNNDYEVVSSIPLSDIFTENNIKQCDFLKIDCEGAEYDILLNCPLSILKKIKIISLEYHTNTKYSVESLVEALKKAKFNITLYPDKIDKNMGILYATQV